MNVYEKEKLPRNPELDEFLKGKYNEFRETVSCPNKLSQAFTAGLYSRLIRLFHGLFWGLSDGYMTACAIFGKNSNSGRWLFGAISQLIGFIFWAPINTIPLTILSLFKTREESAKLFSDIRQSVVSGHKTELIHTGREFFPGAKIPANSKFGDMYYPVTKGALNIKQI